MTHTQIKHIATGHYSKLRKHLKKIIEYFDTETIHEFRVEYKKLRAFLRLLSFDKRKKEKIKISPELKSTYQCLGHIRDLQLQRQRVLETTINEHEKPRAHRIILQKEINRLKPGLIYLASKEPVEESKKETLPFLPHQFKVNIFKNFILEKWEEIYAIILSENFSDENLHSIRKNLKDLFYNMKIYKGKNYKTVSAMILNGWNEQDLNQLLEELGNYHDMCTAIALAQPGLTETLDERNKKALENVKNNWIKNKETLKNVLIKKIKNTIKPAQHIQEITLCVKEIVNETY